MNVLFCVPRSKSSALNSSQKWLQWLLVEPLAWYRYEDDIKIGIEQWQALANGEIKFIFREVLEYSSTNEQS